MATLSWDKEWVIEVPCKIFLPETRMSYPELYIFPDAGIFRRIPPGSCSGLTGSIGSPPDIEFKGRDVHISGGTLTCWDAGLDEGYFKIYPSELIITHHFRGGEHDSPETDLIFHLTPSKLLSPTDFRKANLDGSVDIEPGESFSVCLENNLSIEFKNHYRWKTKGDKIIGSSELVGILPLSVYPTEEQLDHLVNLMDDFLLLVSLAEGQECIIHSYDIHYAEKIVTVYRLNRSIPKLSESHSFNNFLIDYKEFQTFMETTWKCLQTSDQKNLVRLALQLITNDSKGVMELKFLAFFQSIEAILMVFKLNNFRNFIKNPTIERLSRRVVKELEGVKLKEAFNAFISEKNLNVSDLWPFCNADKILPLIKIRNHLVHGGYWPPQYIQSLGVAIKNVEWYAKRMILAYLDWDVNQSRAFFEDSKVKEWKIAIEMLKPFFEKEFKGISLLIEVDE